MIYLGEYKEIENSDAFPSIKDCISDVPLKNKNQILAYLKNEKFVKGAIPSVKHDYFTKEHIGGECLYYSDGRFWWDYVAIYYFERYNMELPQEFIKIFL